MKFIFLIFTFFCIGCNLGKRDNVDKWTAEIRREGGVLRKYSYNQHNKIKTKSNLSSDSLKLGAEYTFLDDGKVDRWNWYAIPGDSAPYFTVGYNSTGVSWFKGDPLVIFSTFYDSLWLEIINPPVFSKNLAFIAKYSEIDRFTIKDKYILLNYNNDSVCQIAIPNFKYNHKLKYTFSFYCMDTTKLDSSTNMWLKLDSVVRVLIFESN